MLTAETVDATARACFDMHRLEAPFTSGTKGVMHACGHDGHTAIAITMAETMSARRAEVAGTSVFIFQPAEEVISGAEPMIAAGVLDDPHVDEVYGLHRTTLTAAGHVEVGPRAQHGLVRLLRDRRVEELLVVAQEHARVLALLRRARAAWAPGPALAASPRRSRRRRNRAGLPGEAFPRGSRPRSPLSVQSESPAVLAAAAMSASAISTL